MINNSMNRDKQHPLFAVIKAKGYSSEQLAEMMTIQFGKKYTLTRFRNRLREEAFMVREIAYLVDVLDCDLDDFIWDSRLQPETKTEPKPKKRPAKRINRQETPAERLLRIRSKRL